MKKIYIVSLIMLLPAINLFCQDWEEALLREYNSENGLMLYQVTSELNPVDPFEGIGKYSGQNLFDNNLATAWVEGEKGYGKGVILYLSPGSDPVTGFTIHNGYQKSDELYDKNSRVKTLKVTLMAGFYIEGQATEFASVYHAMQLAPPKNILIADLKEAQNIKLPWSVEEIEMNKSRVENEFNEKFAVYLEKAREMCPTCPPGPTFRYILKLELVDTYHGSSWDDTCISEIELNSDIPMTILIPDGEKIKKIYEDEKGEKVYVDTELRRGMLLADVNKLPEAEHLGEGEHINLGIMDTSPDKEWVQVDIMISVDGGRAEEFSLLCHVRSLSVVPESLLKTKYGMYGFVKERGKLYLDTADGLIDLEALLTKLKN